MSDNYEEIKKRLDDLFKNIIQEQYKQFDKTKSALVAYYEISKKHDEILKRYHWPPFARTYTDDMKELISINENGDDDEQISESINSFFVNRLKNNNYKYLDYLLESWESITELQNRLLFLQQIVMGFKNGYFSLVIPVIIIQIEGIIAEFNHHNGKIYYDQNKEYFRNLFSINGNVSNDNPANNFILDKFYENFTWGDCKEHEISRHAIIHGQDTKYATETNATKMIHLLDFVIYVAYLLGKES